MSNTNSEFLETADSAPQRISGLVEEGVSIPIVAEQLEIGTRLVETGRVRITKTVRTHEETIDEPVLREQVSVERVPIGQPVPDGESPTVRYEGDVMVVPVLEEVLVVTKQLVLKEELRITRTRTRTEQYDPQSVALRSEEVVVERISAARDNASESI